MRGRFEKWTLLLTVLLVVFLLALTMAPARAALPLSSMDVAAQYWWPLHGGDKVLTPALTYFPARSDKAIDCPTNKGEVWPWAVENFFVTIPFQGDENTLVKLKGMGAGEQAKVLSIGPASLSGGLGYLDDTGFSAFANLALFEVIKPYTRTTLSLGPMPVVIGNKAPPNGVWLTLHRAF